MKPYTVDNIRIDLPMIDVGKVRQSRQRQMERARARFASADQQAAPVATSKPATPPKVMRAKASPAAAAVVAAQPTEAKAQEQGSELTQLLFPNGL